MNLTMDIFKWWKLFCEKCLHNYPQKEMLIANPKNGKKEIEKYSNFDFIGLKLDHW